MSSNEEINDGEIDSDPEMQVNNEDTYVETMETEDQDNPTESNNQDEENKTVIKPKRVIRNPQPKLNEQTLKGPRGLQALEGYFERVKFKGKGYEEHDLNMLMKTYEYWCHRLFPKYPFESCIARLEALGAKRVLVTHMKKIRMGVADEDEDKPLDSDDEIIPEANNGFVNEIVDPFDQLLPSQTATVNLSTELTDEQHVKIQQNKENAEKIRREKLMKIKERSSALLLPSSSQQPQDMFSQHSSIENGDIDGRNVCLKNNEISKDYNCNKNIEHQLIQNNILHNKEETLRQPQCENNLTLDSSITNEVIKQKSSEVNEDLENTNTDQYESLKNIQHTSENQSDDENEVNLENILDIINEKTNCD